MRYRILTLLFFIIGMLMAGAQNNTLSIPSVTTGPGQTISLPVNLDNTADVVAIQFTLSVADGIILRAEEAVLTERAKGLGVRMKEMGSGKYMAMIFSSDNQVISGRTGTVMTVPLTVVRNFADGVSCKMTLSDVVISMPDGTDVVTGFEAGSVEIGKSTDLVVSNVSSSNETINPGGELSLNWMVENIGGQPSGAGWNEQLFLETSDGSDVFLSTIRYENVLNAGGVVSRSAQIVVPEILGIDGNARLKVRIVPTSATGEPSWLLDNNVAVSGQTLNVGKFLYLSPEIINVEERSGQNVRLYLSRSGGILKEETFPISPVNDSRIVLPESVTIPAGQSGVYLYATIVPNGRIDDNSAIEFEVSGNGYDPKTAIIHMEDDTYPALRLRGERDEVTEGESLRLSIEVEREPKEDIDVIVTCDLPERFNIPTVKLPAGETSVDFIIDARDNDIPDAIHFVTFTASAGRYNPASFDVDLIDDDVPTLELSVSPDAVSEAAGPLSMVATLRRSDNIDKPVTIKFTDDSDGNIYYSRQSVEMAPGVQEFSLPLGPVDNALVDGERTYHITASVWIASCKCSAGSGSSGGSVVVPVTFFDNDGPSLSIKSSASVVKEGGEFEATVTRNTDVGSDLVVNIETDHDSDLELPSSVVIPAGKSSASFIIKSIANDITGDGFTAVVTVECDGFAKANTWFIVSDQTLPDALVSSIRLSEYEIEAGGSVSATVVVENTGSYELPELTKVGFYLDSGDTPLATAYLQSPLAPGESVEIVKPITLPDAVGEYSLYAIVNDGQAVKELLYTNNSSSQMRVRTMSPFSFTVGTERQIYGQNEPVAIRGRVSGKDVANKSIDVYVVNDGFRKVLEVETESDGSFELIFEPYQGQMGHFAIGACYHGEKKEEEMASFDVYGIKRTSITPITCETLLGEEYNDSFGIRNPGTLSLSDLKVEVVDVPDNCQIEFEAPTHLDGGESGEVSFLIRPVSVSDGDDWQRINIRMTSKEGVSLPVAIYFYCRQATGKLRASVPSIKTTMVKDDVLREYPFEIANVGKGETGVITLSLPDWMKSVTPIEMASLANGETAQVILRLYPTEDMALNVPVSGQIGVNCANGSGLAIPFSIEPVSEKTGVLTIDVCDENTYYTSEAPHLKNASVEITHPTTGQLISSGVTDEDGKFSAVLNEGYYSVYVNAPHHDTYRNSILVDPGKEKTVTVNLSIEAITVGWTVRETEIEDEYKIVTNVQYETNVPVPVVELSMPESIPAKQLAVGESLIFNAVLTNHGLITAKDVEVLMPEGFSALMFEPLAYAEPFDLAPKQSVTVPIRVTHVNEAQMPSAMRVQKRARCNIDDDPCVAYPGTLYFWECGPDGKMHRVAVAIQVGACNSKDPNTWNPERHPRDPEHITPPGLPGIGGISSVWVGSTGWGMSGSGMFNGPAASSMQCHPSDPNSCWPRAAAGCAATGASCAGAGGLANVAACGVSLAASCTSITSWWDAINCGLAGGGCIPGPAGCVLGGAGCLSGLVQCILNTSNQRRAPAYAGVDGLKDTDLLALASNLISLANDRYLAIMGNEVWLDVTHDDLVAILDYVDDHINDRDELEIGPDWESVKPENIKKEDMLALFERFANTELAEQGKVVDGDNVADMSYLREINSEIAGRKSEVIQFGFDDLDDFAEAVRSCLEDIIEDAENENSSSVCSSITLQFEQSMVMTRQAFRGTLTVFNGHESVHMDDVRLNLIVTDEEGKVATSHEFQITPETLEGFEGSLSFEDGWRLAPETNGILNVLFIPTKFAAPDLERRYSFGGVLSYVDPFTGLEVVRPLTAVVLTVKPSPNLDLTYFMQRDIIGDDPLTEVAEPSEEAEFALLIRNVGYGDATNVRMVTQQPEIVENEKGLLIDFELISSQLNGGDRSLALGGSVATDFGDIPAMSSSYAQWWIRSSLLGHFTDYNVEASHVTSYDNPDLSLLNNVEIHELIRSIDIDNESGRIKGFMTNDISDPQDCPDMLYLSNGEIEHVSAVSSSQITKISDREYALRVIPSSKGWNYGNIIDPTYGVSKLNKVVRNSDGKELSLRNFWQTDRTLRDGKDPLYENRIHFADDFDNGSEVIYTLTFDPLPELFLDVVTFEGVPDEGTVAHAHIPQVKVVFNKQIDPESFDANDVILLLQGEKQDTGLIGISTDDNKTFVLDFTEINRITGNGYYLLTVQTSDIVDHEGFMGRSGKSVGWNMYIDGLLLLDTSVMPEQSGVISGSRNVRYGESFTLAEVPNDGYVFSHWTADGEVVSRDAEWSSVAINDMNVVANFLPKSYTISVNEPTHGEIEGMQTGIYAYGDELEFKAVPNEDYQFDHWIVDDVAVVGSDNTLRIVVSGDTEISAFFKYVGLYTRQIKLETGWNWISYGLSPNLSVSELMEDERIGRVLGHASEMIRDAQFGLVGSLSEISPSQCYKVETSGPISMRFSSYERWEPSAVIALERGWNWLGYPLDHSLGVEDALAGISAEPLDVIVGQDGFSQYDGEKWVGTLSRLVPGNGYLYQSQSEKAFAYPSVDDVTPNYSLRLPKRQWSDFIVDIHKYKSVMPMVATLVSKDGTEIGNHDYQVTAFCGTECRGIGRVIDGLVHISIYGDPNDIIEIRVSDTDGVLTFHTGMELKFSERVVGDLFNPFAIVLDQLTGVSDAKSHGKVRVFVEEDMLRIMGIPAADIDHIDIFDTNGHKLLHETNISESGIKISTLTNGVYVVIVNGNGEYTYHKIAVR